MSPARILMPAIAVLLVASCASPPSTSLTKNRTLEIRITGTGMQVPSTLETGAFPHSPSVSVKIKVRNDSQYAANVDLISVDGMNQGAIALLTGVSVKPDWKAPAGFVVVHDQTGMRAHSSKTTTEAMGLGRYLVVSRPDGGTPATALVELQ